MQVSEGSFWGSLFSQGNSGRHVGKAIREYWLEHGGISSAVWQPHRDALEAHWYNGKISELGVQFNYLGKQLWEWMWLQKKVIKVKFLTHILKNTGILEAEKNHGKK